MPGLYRSPGLADIDVCYGKREAGTEALKRTSRRYEDESAAVEDLLQRPKREVTLPVSGAHNGADEQDIWAEEGSRLGRADDSRDVEMSDGSMHEGYGDRRVEETGMPPTPPDGISSEETQEQQPPLFADGVRNALSSQKSGALSTTPVNPQLSPPTPDMTPPAHPQNIARSPSRERTPEATTVNPTYSEERDVNASRPHLETFKTARETLPVVEGDGEVYLPESDRIADHWLDDAANKPDLTGLESKVTDADDPPAVDTTSENGHTPPRSRYRFESPCVEREETDWEKHISYVSGPDELDLGDVGESPPEMKESKADYLAGLGVSGVEMEQRQRSAEDINNSVYRQIQQDNIRRESAISTNSAAVRAGIRLPSVGSTPKSIRRRAKCSSLRDSDGGRRQSEDSAQPALKHEKRHLPTRTALQESPVFIGKASQVHGLETSPRQMRQASSPATLGMDPSKRATMNLASKLYPGDDQHFRSDAAHKLKRQSHAERLSKNMSVRRTSQEVSPSDLEEAFDRIDRGAASVRKQRISTQQRARMDTLQSKDTHTPPLERQAQMNQGVKRSKVPNGDAEGHLRLRKTTLPMAPDQESPIHPRKVRRYSREERLENNEQLRRFSSDQSQPLDMADPRDHRRQLSTESTTARRSSLDPSLLSSPRKSLDARFLHPTTTPMSTSGFSDRTADIEVCEASGVRIYPHNNHSLLVVQQGSRPVSKDKEVADSPTMRGFNPNAEPIFAAQVDPPTPDLGSSDPDGHLDSPLTNPRAAPQPPQPPSIQFIPPTPNEELDRELGDSCRRGADEGTLTGELNLPGRNLSFKQRFRRYSDSFFGVRTRPPPRQLPPRDTHLSPMWRPQRFWEDDYDSEDDYYDEYEPESDVLPPGGDTSHFDDDNDDHAGNRRRPLFPRAMSKHLPSLRRNNPNNAPQRRNNDYVSTKYRTLSKRESQELLQSLAAHPARPLSSSRSQESLRRSSGRQQGFKVPFTGGMRARWVGTQAVRDKMRDVRLARQEREREKRREELKGRIGMRVYHGS